MTKIEGLTFNYLEFANVPFGLLGMYLRHHLKPEYMMERERNIWIWHFGDFGKITEKNGDTDAATKFFLAAFCIKECSEALSGQTEPS